MLKLLTLLLALALLASVWAVLRRRIKRALKVAAILYILLLVIRLTQVQTDQERLLNVAAVLGLFLLAWLLIWGVTTAIASRRNLNSPTHR